jgi:hypothetical protein
MKTTRFVIEALHLVTLDSYCAIRNKGSRTRGQTVRLDKIGAQHFAVITDTPQTCGDPISQFVSCGCIRPLLC